ncbi:hypothetical protein QBC39DRAFT_375627 [Podospora conica]|nr:hypothetical protein QBC39DRAFT_375627 [Schizothecium conicum]
MGGLSEDALLRIMTTAITAANTVRNNNNPNGPNLKPVDIGFFNPGKKSIDTPNIVDDGKTSTYVDVFTFTDRLKHIVATSPDGEAQVRRAWTACLKGPALEWHSHVLSTVDRQLLETARIEVIYAKLIERFKPSSSEALTSVKRSKYTLWDVQQSKDILNYVQYVIRDAKGAEFTDRGQLVAAFDSFDADIQSELTYPTDSTTLDSFMKNIRDRYGYTRGRGGTYANQQPAQHFQPYRMQQAYNYNRGGYNSYNNRGRSGYNNFGNNSGSNNQGYNNQGYGNTQGYTSYQFQQPARLQPQQQQNALPAPATQQAQQPPANANRSTPYAMTTPAHARNQLVPENRRLMPAPPTGPKNQQGNPRAYYGGDYEDHGEWHPEDYADQEDEGPTCEDDVEDFDNSGPVIDDNTRMGMFAAESIEATCKHCQESFDSNNKLMTHVYAMHVDRRRPRGKHSKSPEEADETGNFALQDRESDDCSPDAPTDFSAFQCSVEDYNEEDEFHDAYDYAYGMPISDMLNPDDESKNEAPMMQDHEQRHHHQQHPYEYYQTPYDQDQYNQSPYNQNRYNQYHDQ